MSAVYREKPQLHMRWPAASRRHCPPMNPPTGYSIRTFRPGEEEAFLALMACSDFDPWDEARWAYNVNRIIPGGWFFATNSSDRIVATAMCLHNYSDRSLFTGDVAG